MLTHSLEHCGREAVQDRSSKIAWQHCSFVTPLDMERILAEVLRSLETAGFSDREQFGVRLALEEAIMNAIRHGHRYDRRKQVHLRYQVTPERLLVDVEDEGPGFDPSAVPDPCAPEYRERESGRGLLLMRRFMTWVRYNERGTCVTMCKHHAV